MKAEKDTIFVLSSFLGEQEQAKEEYKNFQRLIENNGCFIVKSGTDTVKIYTAALAVIFTSNDLPAFNRDTKTETTINGRDYIETYIKGYKEGEQYFENEFKVSPTTLYGANAEQYVRDIHLNFFHIPHTGLNEGWSYVKKSYPIILTHKVVKEFGFYSGVVNKVEEQVKKHPRLFATFDKCEHDLLPQPIQTKTNKLSELITHTQSANIVEAVKVQYKNIKGKRLKLLLYALQDLNLLPKERIAQKFYECCKNEFNWDIASYNAMNGYNYNEGVDKEEVDEMKRHIETLITQK